MSKTFSFLLLCFLFISCKKEVKNLTPEEFGETLFTFIKEDNFEEAKKILVHPADSVLATSSKLKKEISENLGKDSVYAEYISQAKKNFQEKLKDGSDLGINWSKAKFKSIEYEEALKDSIYTLKDTKIYFSYEGRDYYMNVNNVMKIGDTWKNFRLFSPIDVLEEKEEERKYKEELAKQPYTPSGVGFTRANWEYTHKTFENFHVTLENSTSHDIEYIKYRITLYDYTKGLPNKVFSKVYEKHTKIHAGDIVRFEVEDLQDFYFGSSIAERKNFDWAGEVLDIKPRRSE